MMSSTTSTSRPSIDEARSAVIFTMPEDCAAVPYEETPMNSQRSGPSIARMRSDRKTTAPVRTPDQHGLAAGVVAGDLPAQLVDPARQLVGVDEDALQAGRRLHSTGRQRARVVTNGFRSRSPRSSPATRSASTRVAKPPTRTRWRTRPSSVVRDTR